MKDNQNCTVLRCKGKNLSYFCLCIFEDTLRLLRKNCQSSSEISRDPKAPCKTHARKSSEVCLRNKHLYIPLSLLVMRRRILCKLKLITAIQQNVF